MSWWSKLKQVAHTITHPRAVVQAVAQSVRKAEKKVGNTIEKAAITVGKTAQRTVKQAGADIVKVAKVADKVGTEALKVTGQATQFVEDHAKVIKEVVNVTAGVIEVVGTVTGQPEIVAAASELQFLADKALDLAAKAKIAQDVAQKAILVARAIAEKKKISVIVKRAGTALTAAGKASGNKDLETLGGHVTKGSVVIGKAISHSEELHKILKSAKKAIEDKDIGAGVDIVIDTVKEGIKIGKTSKEIKSLYKDVKSSRLGKRAVKLEQKLEKTKAGKAVKKEVKKVLKESKKRKRAPSAYNIFIGKHIKAGGTFKSAVADWNKQKKST